MIVVDTSAVIAILFDEPGYEVLENRLLVDPEPVLSAVGYMEASMVLVGRRGEGAELELDRLLSEANVVVIPVSVTLAKSAREAFIKYGKGRHRAGLNFGDCFSYALAKQMQVPLLFKGNDFIWTDLPRV